MSKIKNKESVVSDTVTIVCVSIMIPFTIALACTGEYECALLGIILARLMLMEKQLKALEQSERKRKKKCES